MRPSDRSGMGSAFRVGFAAWLTSGVVVGVIVERPPTLRAGVELNAPRPGDDATYRPTVMVRRGKSLGTGTIIGSVEGETLVLTASHVVESDGPIHIEVFRYNFGLEKSRTAKGFPRRLPATIAARDADADLAILRIKGQLAFPYVAKIARGVDPPPDGMEVTTLGFDRGERLIGFSTKVRGIERIDMAHGGGNRPFVVTEHPPELGRSGGGLFRPDGALVGVCVARAELVKGRKVGLFTALSNVKTLIRSDIELGETITRSNARAKSASR